MEWWQIVLVVALMVIAAAGVGAYLLWRRASKRTRELATRIGALTWRSRLLLMRRLLQDQRVPPPVRLVPPLLVLYLALPIDLLPDFVPVLGQLDDVAVAIVAIALLSKYVPVQVIEAHLAKLERPA